MTDTPSGYSLGGGSNSVLSPEEVRRKRLEAISGAQSAGTPTEDSRPAQTTTTTIPMDTQPSSTTLQDNDEESSDFQSSLALSKASNATAGQPAEETPASVGATVPTTKPSTDTEWIHTVPSESFPLETFHSIMWDDAMTTSQDKERWMLSGIDIRGDDSVIPNADALRTSHISWGLAQQHGGPCGVLAAVQAEMLRLLLDSSSGEWRVHAALARTIAVVLARVALTPLVAPTTTATTASNGSTNPSTVRVVLPTCAEWPQRAMQGGGSTNTTTVLKVHTISCDEDATGVASGIKRQKRDASTRSQQIDRWADRIYPFIHQHLDSFRNPGGVMLLVMSLTATRPALAQEFDDPLGTKLTGQFGHCGQELMNLMLTGQAVSNVFDNSLSPSGDMVCRGIQSRPAIGYLSQLEALRYCEVGSYYKSPHAPIWVVGSTSHFTVLFGDADALKESKSDVLLDECRRAFKSVEGGEENGFIQSSQLETVLQSLKLDLGSGAQTLAASLEVGGAGIILWDDFWKTASRLMTGATLESILETGDRTDPIVIDGPPSTVVAASVPANETDEEMARRLDAEWSSPGMAALSAAAVAASASLTPDEEYARKLQAEYDCGGSMGSTGAVNGGCDALPELEPTTSLVGMDIESSAPAAEAADSKPASPPAQLKDDMELADSKPAAPPAQLKDDMEFEQFGDTFSLYHYNGLREGVLTSFKITRLTAVEAVGASIALNRGGSSGSQDLEDVVRTKWPSCSIDWLGGRPPYID